MAQVGEPQMAQVGGPKVAQVVDHKRLRGWTVDGSGGEPQMAHKKTDQKTKIEDHYPAREASRVAEAEVSSGGGAFDLRTRALQIFDEALATHGLTHPTPPSEYKAVAESAKWVWAQVEADAERWDSMFRRMVDAWASDDWVQENRPRRPGGNFQSQLTRLCEEASARKGPAKVRKDPYALSVEADGNVVRVRIGDRVVAKHWIDDSKAEPDGWVRYISPLTGEPYEAEVRWKLARQGAA